MEYGNYAKEQKNEENVFNDADHYIKVATNKKPYFEVVEAKLNGSKATIKVKATDEDDEDLTYKLYTGTSSTEADLLPTGEEKTVKQGQEVSWEINVDASIDNYYKVEVKDRYATISTGVRKIGRLIEDIALDKTELKLRIGYPVQLRDNVKQLTAIITPSDAGNQTLEWISSDTLVATVDGSGIVTGLKVGKTTITVKTTDGSNKQATCEVTVETSYGLEVAYTVRDNNLQTELTNAGIGWRILYADKDYTYIIASDYIPRNEICIKPKNGKLPEAGWYDGTVRLSNMQGEYNGYSDITDPKLRALHSQLTNDCQGNGAKNMAYLMDQDIWNGYTNEGAYFAIGGPTLDMIMKSWSEKKGEISKTGVHRYQSVAVDQGYEASVNWGQSSSTGLYARL